VIESAIEARAALPDRVRALDPRADQKPWVGRSMLTTPTTETRHQGPRQRGAGAAVSFAANDRGLRTTPRSWTMVLQRRR